MVKLPLDLGGVSLAVDIADKELGAAAAEKYSAFAGDGSSRPLQLRVKVTQEAGKADVQNIQVEEDGQRTWALRNDFTGWIDTSKGTAELQVYPTKYPDVSLEAFLRFAVSLWAIKNGGMLLHSASVIVEGIGYGFLGRSGAGKSTLARLAKTENIHVLSDEITLIRNTGSGWMISGTPFTGEEVDAFSSASAPLKALSIIRKSSDMRVAKPRRGTELRQLARHVLFFGGTVSLAPELLASLLSVLDNVGLKVLHFRPESQVWELINDLS